MVNCFGVLNGCAGPCRNPGWIAHHEGRTTCGKKIRLHHLHLPSQAQSRQIFSGAGQCSRILVGGDDVYNPTPRQHGGEHATAGANIKG